MAYKNEIWETRVADVALATELHLKLKVSHRQAKGIIDIGCVKVNDQIINNYGTRLKTSDKIEVSFDPNMAYTARPRPSKSRNTPFDILWEDKHLVFVNKPAGLLTVPTDKQNEPCLAEAITDHYRRRGFKRFHLFIAHRLDRYTSGVLVFAKTPEALRGLKKIFEEHNLRRIYSAILVGELPENVGTLSNKLIECKSMKMVVVPNNSNIKHEVKGARLAITHYRVIERLPGHTVVEVKLETGRRNQIRVQFAERGLPLLGDQIYGSTSNNIDRQALHAEMLGLRHPITDEIITVVAPMPKDIKNVLKVLRNTIIPIQTRTETTSNAGLYNPRTSSTIRKKQHNHDETFAKKNYKSKVNPNAINNKNSMTTSFKKTF
jgi:23S rRNA pseudouridine1911/1915/1917 synthase